MTDADVHLVAQPRLDTMVTAFSSDARRLRTDYAGIAWIGDQPDPDNGLPGPAYTRRGVESQLFLPDTHWYDVAALDEIEVQVHAGLLHVAATSQRTQGLVGALAEPVAEFFEHPDGLDGAGLCLGLRGEIFSNLGISYRITVLSPPEAVLRVGESEGGESEGGESAGDDGGDD